MSKLLYLSNRKGNLFELPAAELDSLRSGISSDIHICGDPGYERARKIWNAAINHKPALIVCCSDESDVASAVRFANRHQIAFSVRGGGHNISGRGLINDGMTINLSAMNQVNVDPDLRQVDIQGGVLLRDVDQMTARYDLAVPLGVAPTTGAVGLALGGGMGRLSRKFGLTCDSLKAARIVLATGDILDVSEQEHPDLFWALKGGDGNFGIVTRMVLALHPIPEQLLSGKLIFPESQLIAGLKLHRELLLSGPDELGLDATLSVNSQGVKTLEFTLCYNGPERAGRELLKVFDPLGEPLVNGVQLKTYPQIQHSDHTPPGRRYYYRTGFIDTLNEELMELLVQELDRLPLPGPGAEFFIAMQQAGGAVGRVPVSATAFPHRNALCNVIAMCITDDPEECEALKQRIDSFSETVRPYYSGLYANDASDQLAKDATGIFGSNLVRLKTIKRRYDPDNIFNLNANIAP